MANKDNVAKFTMQVKENTYKGQTYPSLVGSFGVGGGKRVLVALNCDSDGNIKTYTSEKGKVFCYARAVKYSKTKSTTRFDEMR